jgi:Protein of unknown function (DUF1997)
MSIQASAQANLKASLPATPEQVRLYVRNPQRLLRSGFPSDRITQVGPDRFRLKMLPLVWMGLALEPTAEIEIGANDQGEAWARLIDYELVGHPWLVQNLKLDFRAHLSTSEKVNTDGRTPMDGWAQASASFPTPPFLAWMPNPVLTGGARTILEGFLWLLKDRLGKSLEASFWQWAKSGGPEPTAPRLNVQEES